VEVKMRNLAEKVKRAVNRHVGFLVGVGLVLFSRALANPLEGPMERISDIICSVMEALAGPFGAALAVLMLGLGFAGLIIGNRNSMGLIITAIAGGALLLAARTLGDSILGATACQS